MNGKTAIKTVNRLRNSKKPYRYGATIRPELIMAAMLLVICMSACTFTGGKYADFRRMPSAGWTHAEPYYFDLQYPDSSEVYDLYVAVRYDNGYEYTDLNLATDVFAHGNSYGRMNVRIPLVDIDGKQKGRGFGALYQTEVLIKKNVRAGETSKVVVWQTMKCDTLTHLTELGVVLKPKAD